MPDRWCIISSHLIQLSGHTVLSRRNSTSLTCCVRDHAERFAYATAPTAFPRLPHTQLVCLSLLVTGLSRWFSLDMWGRHRPQVLQSKNGNQSHIHTGVRQDMRLNPPAPFSIPLLRWVNDVFFQGRCTTLFQGPGPIRPEINAMVFLCGSPKP